MKITQIGKRSLRIFIPLLALAFHPLVDAAAQQAGRPITIIVPYTPGTGVDVLARAIGEEIQRRWNRPVIVDNKPGASGAIGSQLAARAAPDGQTLLIHTEPTFTAHASMVKNLSYDPVKSFTPIIEVAAGTLVLVVHASLGVASTPEFIAHAKARPGKIDYGTPGMGTPHHLTMESFKLASGIDLTHVPFRDSAGLLSNLLGGHVGATIMPVNFALPLPRDKVRLLAVMSANRLASVPGLPTIAEQGFADFESSIHFGFLGPARMPREIVARYNTEINDILRSPRFIDMLTKQGMTTVGGGAESFSARIADNLVKWRKVVADAGIAVR